MKGRRAALDAREATSRYPNAPHFQRAFLRGVAAARAGRPVEACPYGRTARATKTWRRTWRAVWLAGWEYGTR